MKKNIFRHLLTVLAFISILLPYRPVLAAKANSRQIDINSTVSSVSETSSDVTISGSTEVKISDYKEGDKILYNNVEIENGGLFPENDYFFLSSITPVDRADHTEYLLSAEPVYAVYYSVDSDIGMPVGTAYYVSGSNVDLPAVTVVPGHEEAKFIGWTDKNGMAVSSLELTENTILNAAFSVPGDLRKIASVKVNPFPNSTSLSDILESLPKTAALILDDGSSGQGQIRWSASDPYDPSLPEEQSIAFCGSVTLPDNITNTTQIDTMIKTTVTIYGSEASTYTLTFDLNGGTGDIPEPSSYKAGDRIILCSSVSKAHSKFLGWSPSPESSYANAGSSSMTMPSHDVILYAIWADNESHTITFDIGMDSIAPPDQITVYEGETAVLPFDIVPPSSGRVFSGWAKEPDAAQPEYTSGGVSTLTISEDTTLYAVYESLKDVFVSYDLNGGQGTSMQDDTTYHAGDNVTVRFIIPSRENHIFLGWSFQEYAYDAEFKADGNTVFTMPNHNVTLYAVWRSNTAYTVSYDINGGIGNVPEDKNSYYTGDEVEVLLSPAPEKENCIFSGWASSASADSPSFYGDENTFQMGTSNIILYAVYQEEPYMSVQYDANGGTKAPVDPTHYHTGDKIKLNFTDLPIYYAHTFLGWAESPDATIPDYSTSSITSFTAVSGSSLKILYAVWDTEEPKHITYDLNGIETESTPKDNTNYYKGDTAFLDFSVTARDSQYTFMGWAKTKDAFEPYYTIDDKKSLEIASEDITLYAVFSSSTDIDGHVNLSYSPGTGRLRAIYEPGRKKADRLTYTWMLGEKTLASGSDPTYTPAEPGEYRVLLSTDRYTGSIASDPLPLYKVTCSSTVILDNPAGLYAKGNTVNARAKVTAGSAAFKEWTAEGISLSSAQKNQNPFSFKMSTKNVSLSYSVTKLYTVKVSGGVANTYSCAEGTMVSLRASNISGHSFEKWIVSGSVSLSDVASPEATFTMPSSNVSLSAVFKPVQSAKSLSEKSEKSDGKTEISPAAPLIYTVLDDGGIHNADIQVKHHSQGPLCVAVFSLARNGFTIYDDYYNITVQNTEPPVYETDQKIRLQISIPEELQKKNRVFRMICVSRFGIPYTYEDLDSNDTTITIETNRFYAYALCYSDDYEQHKQEIPETEPKTEVIVSNIHDAKESDTIATPVISVMRSSDESQTGFLDLDCIGYTSVQKATAIENAADTLVTYCSM